jgi:hypothetical protein
MFAQEMEQRNYAYLVNIAQQAAPVRLAVQMFANIARLALGRKRAQRLRVIAQLIYVVMGIIARLVLSHLARRVHLVWVVLCRYVQRDIIAQKARRCHCNVRMEHIVIQKAR